jgi:hypothetical protein
MGGELCRSDVCALLFLPKAEGTVLRTVQLAEASHSYYIREIAWLEILEI